jgi:hypothetical protein
MLQNVNGYLMLILLFLIVFILYLEYKHSISY